MSSFNHNSAPLLHPLRTGNAPLPGQHRAEAALPSPAFVLDAAAIARNMRILAEVKRRTGCRILLALKAFSSTCAFPLMRPTLDGCCASSVDEARLGREKFGGEIHAFAAAFSAAEMRELFPLVDHVTFNSLAQFAQGRAIASEGGRVPVFGLRVNPEHSEGATPIYDPCAPHSRLGIRAEALSGHLPEGVTGLHCHNLCEQNAEPFARTVEAIEKKFGPLLEKISWFNFGGGHHLTRPDYNLGLLYETLNAFRKRHPAIKALYLEPGEACVLNAGTLVTTVLDVVENNGPIAILDASCACHTPDVMEMPYRPRVFRDPSWHGEAVPGPAADRGAEPGAKPCTFRLAGASCLAGDVFGDWSFEKPLQPGDRLIFEDMALYTIVKTNTFNGIRLPSILLRESGGAIRSVRSFGYADFSARLG